MQVNDDCISVPHYIKSAFDEREPPFEQSAIQFRIKETAGTRGDTNLKKKSIKKDAKIFKQNVDKILKFIKRVEDAHENGARRWRLTDDDVPWCYDLAIIRLYRKFEDLMLSCLVALINNDAATFSEHKERKFPKHMSVEVCEYLICGDGYFDFAGRDGLLRNIREVVPTNHWLYVIVKDSKYKASLDKLSALRNFAAHGSSVSKERALKAIKQKRMPSSGEWLVSQKRFDAICEDLKKMAEQIELKAPY